MTDKAIDTRPYELGVLKGVFDRSKARQLVSSEGGASRMHFSYDDTQAAWGAFRELHFNQMEITPESLKLQMLEDFGGQEKEIDYLIQEILNQPDVEDIRLLVKGLGQLRSRKELAGILEYSQTPEAMRGGMRGLVSRMQEFLLSYHEVAANKAETMTDTLRRLMGREGPVKTWAPGLGDLDNSWKIRKGSYWVIGGDSGSFKTACAINIMLAIARQDTNVGVISIEMTADELTYRAAAMEAGIDSERIEDNNLTEEERKHIAYVLQRDQHIYDRIFILDPSMVSSEDLPGYYNDLVNKYKCEVVIIDYIQRISSKNKNFSGKTDSTGAASETITALTKSKGVATIALSVLSRVGGDGKKGLDNLKHSGQIGHDAHGVVLIDVIDRTDPLNIIIEARSVKNRKGKFFKEALSVNGPTQRIRYLSPMDRARLQMNDE
jgi:replicative DNA helicase